MASYVYVARNGILWEPQCFLGRKSVAIGLPRMTQFELNAEFVN